MRKPLFLLSIALLLASCASIQKEGTNIRALYFDNVPETAIKVGEFDKAGILLCVEYSDRSQANFPITESWLPEQYLHYLGEEGSYEVTIHFRGKSSVLAFQTAFNPDAPKYRVTFLDASGNTADAYEISHRKDAVFHGESPTRKGYIFTGWDQSLYGVAKDMVYRPVFELDI